MNEDIKACIDAFKASCEENFRQLKQQLTRVEERNVELTAEVASLKQHLAATKAELEAVKRAAAEEKAASSARIDKLELRVDDLEQYGRRKSIRVQNVPVVEGEDKDSSLVLAQINLQLQPTGIQLREKDCIRYHRSSKEKDNIDEEVGGKVSQCIIKVKYWSVRRQFQGLNKRCRDGGLGTRVYHDLTKRRLGLLNFARDALEAHPGWFTYADVNSNLKILSGKRFFSFNTAEELQEALRKI